MVFAADASDGTESLSHFSRATLDTLPVYVVAVYLSVRVSVTSLYTVKNG